MSLFIAICDDEKGIGAELESILIDMLGNMNIQHEIDVYFTGEDLCSKMEAGIQYDLIFLDIEFAQNAVNGVEVGRTIREVHQNNIVSIVYISWKMKYSMQLFDIRPLNFLIKPLDIEKVRSVVKTYLNISGQRMRFFSYKVGNNYCKVPNKDILLVAVKIINVFYDKRRTSFRTMTLSLCTIILTYAFIHYFILNNLTDVWRGIAIELAFFVSCFVITFNYKSTIIRRLAAALSVSVIVIFAAICIEIILLFIPNLYTGSDEWLIVANIATLPLAYFISSLISRLKFIRKKELSGRSALIVSLPLVFMAVMLVVLLFVSAFGVDFAEEAGLIFGVVLVGWALFSNFVLLDTLSAKYEEKLKSDRQSQEKEYYYSQCQLMQESAKQVRAIHHDMKNHLATIKTYVTSNKYEDVRNYLDSLMDSIEKGEAYSDTGNIAFDSIINFKLRNAKNDNIQLDLSVAVPPEINVEVVDIVTIIGNMLDNALDAVAKTNNKFIDLDIEFGKGGLFVKIDNSFNGEVNYITDNVEDGKQIASLKSGEQHGHGLKNIKQSIEKYDGYLKTSHTENIFSSLVFLYVDDLEPAHIYQS